MELPTAKHLLAQMPQWIGRESERWRDVPDAEYRRQAALDKIGRDRVSIWASSARNNCCLNITRKVDFREWSVDAALVPTREPSVSPALPVPRTNPYDLLVSKSLRDGSGTVRGLEVTFHGPPQEGLYPSAVKWWSRSLIGGTGRELSVSLGEAQIRTGGRVKLVGAQGHLLCAPAGEGLVHLESPRLVRFLESPFAGMLRATLELPKIPWPSMRAYTSDNYSLLIRRALGAAADSLRVITPGTRSGFEWGMDFLRGGPPSIALALLVSGALLFLQVQIT